MNLRDIFLDRPLAFMKRQRLLRDKFLRWFLFAAVFLLIVELGLLLIKLRPTAFVVPLEYTSGLGFTRLGDWQLIYGYGLFSLMVTITNSILAIFAFERSRISSFFLLLGAIVINIFTIVVTYTLLAQIS